MINYNFTYIPPLSELKEIIDKAIPLNRNKTLRRSYNLSDIPKLTINGKNACKWCGKEDIPKNRHYCSEDCSNSALYYCRPHSHFAKRYLLLQTNNTCAKCGLVAKYYDYHLDHILPIFKGGSIFDPLNRQMLCHPCHAAKTAEERL